MIICGGKSFHGSFMTASYSAARGKLGSNGVDPSTKLITQIHLHNPVQPAVPAV